MMFSQKVTNDILTHRLDSPFYNPKAIEAQRVLDENDNAKTLSQLVDPTRPITNGVRGPDWEESEYKLVRLQDCKDWFVNFSNCGSISMIQFEENRRCILQKKDIVVAIGGYVGNASIVKDHGTAVIGQHSAMLSNCESIIDPYYLLTYLNTKYAEIIFQRYVSGTVQAGVNLEDLRDIKIPCYVSSVQKYIGNKVRQAEMLRGWGKRVESELCDTFERFDNNHGKHYEKYSKVGTALLTHMLTASTYKQEYIDNQKKIIESEGYESILSYFHSISNGYDERSEFDDGMPYVKVADVRPGIISFEDCPKVSPSHWHKATHNQRPEKGDLLITRKGSFGIAAVVQTDEKFLVSSEVFVCKPYNTEIMPLLAQYINSYSGQCQFWQFSTGTTMPGISQQNLFHVLIPDLYKYDVVTFNYLSKQVLAAKIRSKELTNSAKELVESLIENKITEQDLISAQQALEKGDNTLDRQILSRLTTKGIDAEGDPLFPDLDKLYELLDQAEKGEGES